MSKRGIKKGKILCKVEKEEKSLKKWKKGVDKRAWIWYYIWAPLRKGSENEP